MDKTHYIGTTAWEAKQTIKLLSLERYKHLFPKPTGVDRKIYDETTVEMTVHHIPEVVKKFSFQVEKFVEQELMHLPLYEVCKKLWWFVRYHILWVSDGKHETIATPSVLIYSGKGDCDCMTNFIDTCLHVYKVKTLINRTAGYDPLLLNIQHIYTVVPMPSGKQIIIDACWPKFNEEKPYVIKKDYKMELHVLEGIGNTEKQLIGVDANDLFGFENELGELGKLLKKKQQSGGGAAPAKKGILKRPTIQKRSPEKKAAAKEKRKAIGKKALKVVNKVNKINPAIALLRAGLLASMKLNLMKVAEKIKWGYASPEYAQSKGMDMSKFGKVKEVLAKAQQIFYAAGGSPENLKKAILTGHGNKNHEVAGLDGYSEDSLLSELLGEIYTHEFIHGMEGFAGFEGVAGTGLGEPATATAVAAASTAMGTLAALLKSIGDLFPNKGKKDAGANSSSETEPGEEQSGEEQASPESEASENSQSSQEEPTENLPAPVSEETEISPSEESGGEPSENAEPVEGLGGMLSGALSGISGFYEKNKNWIVPVGIVAVGGAVILYISHHSSKDEEDGKQPLYNKANNALSGTAKKQFKNKNRHKYHKHSSNQNSRHATKSVIALM